MQRVGDPHADDTIAAILGACPAPSPGQLADSAAAAVCDAGTATRLRHVETLNAVIRTWRNNAHVATWRADATLRELGMAEPLERYVAVSRSLPEWADPGRIDRAQRMFMDHGALSVTTLLCASLPETYVLPDLAVVLQATGQLTDRTDHRIRATGAMVFPVMMIGGLAPNSEDGFGIAQILKVRLIHAMVRNLILRGPPDATLAALRAGQGGNGSGVIPRLARIQPGDSMGAALHVHGWDLGNRGLPSNQEELAYTLLTFSYVFLRAMRRLDIRFTKDEREDYLHAWSVAGHFLGVDHDLTVKTMDAADELFARIQKRGRAKWAKRPGPDDPRPALGSALMDALQTVFPDGPWKPFPVLLTRRLIGRAGTRDLRLNGRVSWWSRLWFAVLMGLVRFADAIGRIALRDPNFSIARLITRAIGYRLICQMLMKATQPLAVPSTLRRRAAPVIRAWGTDKKASTRMNACEDRYTKPGDWDPPEDPPAQ
jgi:hypothetical protein